LQYITISSTAFTKAETVVFISALGKKLCAVQHSAESVQGPGTACMYFTVNKVKGISSWVVPTTLNMYNLSQRVVCHHPFPKKKTGFAKWCSIHICSTNQSTYKYSISKSILWYL
jgi:hypothetical protein